MLLLAVRTNQTGSGDNTPLIMVNWGQPSCRNQPVPDQPLLDSQVTGASGWVCMSSQPDAQNPVVAIALAAPASKPAMLPTNTSSLVSSDALRTSIMRETATYDGALAAGGVTGD